MPARTVVTPSVASAGSRNSGQVVLNAPTPQTPSAPGFPQGGRRLNVSSSLNPHTNTPQALLGVQVPAAAPGSKNGWMKQPGASLFKTATTNAGLSVGPSQVGASGLAPSETAPSQLTAQLGQMSLNAGATAYNPSMGPTPTQVPTDWRQRAAAAASVLMTGSVRQALTNAVCKLSGRAKRDFRKGDIISLPYHTANLNPKTDPNDPRLKATVEGYVYSKRRMMIVLWLHSNDMFCVPLYTWEGEGLKKKQHSIREYVAVSNVDDIDFVNQGVYQPIEVRCKYKGMKPETAIHLTGGKNVGYSEDIAVVGRATQAGHAALVELFRKLSFQASQEQWRP